MYSQRGMLTGPIPDPLTRYKKPTSSPLPYPTLHLIIASLIPFSRQLRLNLNQTLPIRPYPFLLPYFLLLQFLKEKGVLGDVAWNFAGKFIVDKNGNVLPVKSEKDLEATLAKLAA